MVCPARDLACYEGETAEGLLAQTIIEHSFGNAVLVSSFGTESAVLLHMVSCIDRSFPIIFLNTGKLFGETSQYCRKLSRELGLTAVEHIRPNPELIAKLDPTGTLWSSDPDACCALRKTWPLDAALEDYDAWITGRKRYQSAERSSLASVEFSDGRYKVNPLAKWAPGDISAYIGSHGLPRHPLESRGFPSIGCLPCTSQVTDGEEARAGRWRGTTKTECGIHLSVGMGTSRLPRK